MVKVCYQLPTVRGTQPPVPPRLGHVGDHHHSQGSLNGTPGWENQTNEVLEILGSLG